MAMGETKKILIERDGAVSWIIFNNPEHGNAFTPDMWLAFDESLAALGADKATKVVVLRGAGDNFSKGNYSATIDGRPTAPDYEGMGAAADRDRIAGWLRIWFHIWDLPKPVIAAVHGSCFNHGASICVFSDITVVADDAVIGRMYKLPVGVLHELLWSWSIGWRRAKEMDFREEKSISGRTAAEWGWANYSVPGDELFDNVGALAQEIARYPAEVLRIQKLAHNRVAELQGFRVGAEMAAEWCALQHFSPSVRRLNQVVSEVGYEEATRRFYSGELQLEP